MTELKEGAKRMQLRYSMLFILLIVPSSQAQSTNAVWNEEDENLISPVWTGNDDQGSLFAPLYRGAFVGIEDLVYTPPDGDCTKVRATVRIDWDSAANTVHFLIKGRNFQVDPTVHRTQGVDYFADPFHPAPKDLTNAAYRLWTVLGSTTRAANFYYDPGTLKLLGSEFDFSTPPPGAITIQFPVFSITGTRLFSPDDEGNVLHEYTVPYNRVTVEDGTFARAWATFPPLDLCEAAPLQPGVSQLRPYASPWQPATSAPSWRDMLHAGMGFDLQIDDATPPPPQFGDNLPYVYSGISYVSNMTALQGGVPNGWHFLLLTAIQNVSPNLEAVPNGNGKSCQAWISEPHVTAPRYCEMHP
jgi:hypothetical protein